MLAFYMDHNVHRAITAGLRRRGIDIVTALDDGLAAATDERIFKRALELGRIVVTFDPDFLDLAAQFQESSLEFPGLVYAVQQNVAVGRTVDYLELVAILKSPDEMRNTVEFIP